MDQDKSGATADEQAILSLLLAAVNGNSVAINNSPGSAPTSERILWAMLLLGVLMLGTTAVCVTATFMLAGQVNSERTSREAFDHWSAQEHTTVRGYIWSGRIEPMKPRPEPQEKPK